MIFLTGAHTDSKAMGWSFGPLPSNSGPVGCARMSELSDDAIAEFSQLVAELQERLEQSFAAHDHILARQSANDEENARLRAELAQVSAPLVAIHDLATRTSALAGKLHEVLKPAVLDDTVREEADGLIRSLTNNLEQLAGLARPAGPDAGNSPAAGKSAGGSGSTDSSSDPWAAEIKALSEEFPDQVCAALNAAKGSAGEHELEPQQPSQQSG
jgi:hypothetical protein